MKRQKLNKEYIPITDDFMFFTVMEDEMRCKEFLQRVLGIEIAEIKCVCKQKTLKRRRDSKGVRLDVYVRDIDNNSYDIEMQSTYDFNLAKRTRYYHSEMDGYQIKRGADFENLGHNIVIFVCTFDPFGKGESIYTVKSYCKEHMDIDYDDGLLSIFLNANGRCDGIDEPLANVLKYIQTGSVQDAFTADMEKQVEMLNTDEDWRERHMTLNMEYKHRYKLGYNAGHEDGIKDGREEGLLQGKEEGLKEGLKEGRKEGLKEGASKERDFIISNMLSKGFDAKVIMDVTGCDKKDITRIKEILLK